MYQLNKYPPKQAVRRASSAFGDISLLTCRTYPGDRFSQDFVRIHQSEYLGQQRTCDVQLVNSGSNVIFESTVIMNDTR